MSYDNFATTFSNSRKNHPWPELEYIIEDLKQNEYSSVLDIGCGNGRFLEESLKMNYRPIKYLGIDESEGMIREARKLNPSNQFQVIGMQDMKIIEQSFDVLLFLASFHHLETREERIRVLESTKKLLTQKSRIYMTNWNLLDQERYQKNHRGNGEFDIKIGEFSRYYHGFTLTELSDLFEEAGYSTFENRIFDGGRNIISILSL
ncbi:class I SAM-dependent methyltransferase [Candidatus Gracilibacteria bacterium]|nr:class I SAM-dependent methyltransferase [Candidatus Gracilibacteria bacterium]